ncbi:[protein-PII] uridylyltransferase [Actinospica acidithermotolerans]|uniref:[protein-PII] uridylyltransferase n=1 Tax=Actinospica acidithermotolerans TaxID=2828514 RepID=UPI0027DDBD3A|nr:[protein-PII] uridylyltransferase [Actinospica acidithermotolerans]
MNDPGRPVTHLEGEHALRFAQGREARSAEMDAWLAGLLGDVEGAALVAVGGYGRRQLSPGSDLDVVLLHDGSRDAKAVAELADSVWYPIWDAKVKLDHSVRTVAEARSVALEDLAVVLGMLTARHIAGDPQLTESLRSVVLADWRKNAPRRLPELRAMREQRRERHGELAYRLEGDLKECTGGLRDADSLRAIAASWIADVPHGDPEAAQAFLLDVRWVLHTRTGRAADRILLQEQDELAAALEFESADELMRSVSDAARTIDYACDVAWRRVDQALAARNRSSGISGLLRRGGSSAPPREPLADGVVKAEGEAALALAADLNDPVLPLRIASAAARAGLPISPASLERLAASTAVLPEPWPEYARAELMRLLGAGPGLIPVLEALDRTGLLVRLLPEWERIRSLPQRNALHVHTVDRHIVQTVVHAAERTRRVDRVDLLLAAALFHDLGKGLPGDHCATGADIVAKLAARLSFPAHDIATLVALTRHHLLFAELAVHRDPTDPATLAPLLAAAGESGTSPADFVALLQLLTESDSQATGPAVWSTWRASLYRELGLRAQAVLAGEEQPSAHTVEQDEADLALASQAAIAPDGIAVQAVAPGSAGIGRIDIAIPDQVGALALVAGVLTLRHVRVLSAELNSAKAEGKAYAVQRWTVAAEYGELPDLVRLRTDLRSARAGSLKIADRLATRDQERASQRRQRPNEAPATVRLLPSASETATVLEVRAEDTPGLLHRIAAAIAGTGADIERARIATLGPQAVDVFYLTFGAGSETAVGSAVAEELIAEVRAALN